MYRRAVGANARCNGRLRSARLACCALAFGLATSWAQEAEPQPTPEVPAEVVAPPAPATAPETAEVPDAPARSVVERLQAGLVEAAQAGEELGFDARYARLEPLIEQTHDLDYIARFAARRFWGNLDDAQRESYRQAFARHSITLYARQFSRFGGERFSLTDSRPYAADMRLVETVLSLESGQVIPFDYVLRADESGRWRIVNIIVDGVSDLALKRAQYTAIFRREGYDGLLRALETEETVR